METQTALIVINICVFILLFIKFVANPRIEWVYSQQLEILEVVKTLCEDASEESFKMGIAKRFDVELFIDSLLNQYWSLNKMYLYFWIWDINKMRNNDY